MNQLNNNLNKITHKISEEGVPILEQLVEKLTGKGAVITYSFDNIIYGIKIMTNLLS